MANSLYFCRMNHLSNAISRYLSATGFPRIDLRAVLIDMDGVLYDSMPYHAAAWYEAIASLGIPCVREEFFLYEGRTGASTIDLIFNREYGRTATDEEKEAIYRHKSELFMAKGTARTMPGASDFLQQVKSLGLTPVLVTGSGQQSLLGKLNRDFPGIFTPETMVTAFDVKYGKPHPEPYLMGLQKAGVNAQQAIVVENAPLGVEAGTAARIFTIAVNTGPLSDSVLLDAGANLLLPSMAALAADFHTIYTELNR